MVKITKPKPGDKGLVTDIQEGIEIVGDYLDKSILKPNNINYPVSRTELSNLIK